MFFGAGFYLSSSLLTILFISDLIWSLFWFRVLVGVWGWS